MKIKIGILGCGWIVQNAHLPVIMKGRIFQLIAIYDLDKERMLSVLGEYWREYIYTDFDQFVTSGIEAAIIATPNYTHFNYIKKLCDRGIHVLCEKPIVFTVQQMSVLERSIKKHNIVFMPAFVNRWREDILFISDLLRQEEIGNIIKIEAGWCRSKGVPRPGSWFTNKEMSGGGVVIDLGSHIFDICLMFMGNEEVESIDIETVPLINCIDDIENSAKWMKSEISLQYKIDVESKAKITIFLSNKKVIKVELMWNGNYLGDYTYFMLEGLNGKIELTTLFGFSNERLYKDSLSISYNSYRKKKTFKDSENMNSKAFYKMYEHFYKEIKSEHRSWDGIEIAKQTVRLIEKIYSIVDKKK